MKKHLLLIIMALLPMIASAYDVIVGGLYFNLDANAKTAEVTYGESKQSLAVTIPETITIGSTTYTVTSIGDDTFAQCDKIQSVTLPSSITHIGKSAFYQCLAMTEINIPNSVIEIDEGAFRYCWKLTSIDLPNALTKISNATFSNCNSLETVSIHSSITSIGERAFYGCLKLNTIELPNSVTSIGDNAFNGCSSLSTLNLSETINSVGSYAFSDTKWLQDQPDGVVYIGKVAYLYKGTMPDNTVLEINEGTVQISGRAFSQCQGLVSIKLPETVLSIGEYTFLGCKQLESVHMSSSIKSIGEWAFVDCQQLTSINTLGLLTEISDGTFSNCQNLNSINLPDGLIRIGQQAFQSCGLTSVVLPESLTTIESNAFSNCNGLETIVIPASVSTISGRAFGNNKNLKSISVSIDNPKYDSRNNCNAIIETASNTLLFGCKSTFIPDGVVIIGELSFGGCEGISSVVFPSSVKEIGNAAFASCPLLGTVQLNEGLEIIGEQAFSECSALDLITLPSSVKVIRAWAFAGTNLTNITSLIAKPFVINPNVFYSLYSRATLCVPEGTKANYENVSSWNQFANIVEITNQCATPTIKYEKGKLTFECETEGAEFVTSIADPDIKTYNSSEINLSVTYTIDVYAKATGYKNSETATATLCWIDANPQTEGIEDGVAQVTANPVLIQSNNGKLCITGAKEGADIAVYSTSGVKLGSAIAKGNTTTIPTALKDGEIAIVKIGDNSIKVLVK